MAVSLADVKMPRSGLQHLAAKGGQTDHRADDDDFTWLGQSDAIEARILEQVDKLGTFYPTIMSCRVVVEERHRHHQLGNLFHIRIDIRVPGHELVADREPEQHHAYTDVYVAIRDAFDVMRRQLEDLLRRQQDKVKTHEPQGHGRVAEIEPERDRAWIEAPDGRMFYLNRNSLIEGDFDKLAVGDELRFAEEMGEEGPQASSAYLIGKHHIGG
jgi:ribosome-associated translation inhibitor RaiA